MASKSFLKRLRRKYHLGEFKKAGKGRHARARRHVRRRVNRARGRKGAGARQGQGQGQGWPTADSLKLFVNGRFA